MKRAALVLGVGAAFATAIAGIVVATEGQFSTGPAASSAAPEPEPPLIPNPYGLECPPEDMIASVDNEILGLRNPPQTPRDGLEVGLAEGLKTRSARINPNAASSTEVEFLFEADDGTRIGRAVVEKIQGGWYVTRYVACSSAE